MTCRRFSAAVLRQAERSQAQRTIRNFEVMSCVVCVYHVMMKIACVSVCVCVCVCYTCSK